VLVLVLVGEARELRMRARKSINDEPGAGGAGATGAGAGGAA
jgi:hypothetical protein